jgi:hypothetical protein
VSRRLPTYSPRARSPLPSGVSRSQGTLSFLLVLRAAVGDDGSPNALVSDSGAIFRSQQAQAVYAALGILKEVIERGEPWQDYIETAFEIQRCMAGWRSAQAQTWAELVAVHDQWLEDQNGQEHWAHRQRKDGRRSPQEALGWVTGNLHAPATLERVFRPMRFGRLLDRSDCARYQRWRICGERGLARREAALWVAEEALTTGYGEEPLAQYLVSFGLRRKEVRKISVLRVFARRRQWPQPWLWQLGTRRMAASSAGAGPPLPSAPSQWCRPGAIDPAWGRGVGAVARRFPPSIPSVYIGNHLAGSRWSHHVVVTSLLA